MTTIYPLVKEPILSEDIVNIIYKSRGKPDENTIIKADDVYRFKYHIIQKLTHNNDLLRALHHPSLSFEKPINGDAFIDVAIFDYLKLPENKSEVKNYLCYEVDILNGGTRNYYAHVTFRIVCHDEDLKTDWNINRMDLLSLIIRQDFNWEDIFGEKMVLMQDMGNMTQQRYYYRDLVFQVQLPNDYHTMTSRSYG